MILFNISAVAEETYDIRNVNWGMSLKEVRNQEKSDLLYPLTDNFKNKLIYADKINNYTHLINYQFNKLDELYLVIYLLEETPKNGYLDYYEVIKEKYTNKYGKPKTDKIKGEIPENTDKIKALKNEQITIKTVWENEYIQLTIEIEGDKKNNEIIFSEIYISKLYLLT